MALSLPACEDRSFWATDLSPAFPPAVASRLLSMKCKRAAQPPSRANHRLGHTGREHVQRPHVHREYAAAVGTLVAAQAARHAWRQRQGKQERQARVAPCRRLPGTFARNRVCLVAVGAGGGLYARGQRSSACPCRAPWNPCRESVRACLRRLTIARLLQVPQREHVVVRGGEQQRARRSGSGALSCPQRGDSRPSVTLHGYHIVPDRDPVIDFVIP